jgi:hypothetical protein
MRWDRQPDAKANMLRGPASANSDWVSVPIGSLHIIAVTEDNKCLS